MQTFILKGLEIEVMQTFILKDLCKPAQHDGGQAFILKKLPRGWRTRPVVEKGVSAASMPKG
jgi:hypothetical protein